MLHNGPRETRPADPVTAPAGKRPQIRELALGELLDVSFKLCLAHWQTLLKAVLVVIVPVQIHSTLVTADYTLSSFDIGSSSDQSTRDAIDAFSSAFSRSRRATFSSTDFGSSRIDEV